jgi:hypothetical protein
VDAYGYRFPGKEITYTWNEKRKNFGIPNNLIMVDQNFLPQDAFLAFGVEANDQMSQKTEHFGIFSTKTILNQDTMFYTCMDNISFDHSRYVNSHKDYEAYKGNKQKIHKLFKNVANPLEVYKLSTNGAFRPIPNDTLNVEIMVGDANQQFAKLNLKIVYVEKDLPSTSMFYSPQTHFIPDSAYQFKNAKYEVFIVRKFFGSEIGHVLNHAQNGHIDRGLFEHCQAFHCIGQSHFLRCSNDDGSRYRNRLNKSQVDIAGTWW